MIDVIIPCYNAEQTLVRAVQSALNQAELGKIWLVDDSSTDRTFELMLSLKKQFPEKICIEQMPKNCGVAKARNWGALQSEAEIIAFLAQLEDFQKKLWLKKKFVAGCHYLITLDHLNEAQVQAALDNPKQTTQWQSLFNVNTSDLNTAELCKNYPHLVVDTSLFALSSRASASKEAKEFMEFLTQDQQVQQDLFRQSQGTSVLPSVVNSSESRDLLKADDFGVDSLTNRTLDQIMKKAVLSTPGNLPDDIWDRLDYLIHNALKAKDIDNQLPQIQKIIEEMLREKFR